MSDNDIYAEGWDGALDVLAAHMRKRVGALEANGSVTSISRELSEWLDAIEALKMKRHNAAVEKE